MVTAQVGHTQLTGGGARGNAFQSLRCTGLTNHAGAAGIADQSQVSRAVAGGITAVSAGAAAGVTGPGGTFGQVLDITTFPNGVVVQSAARKDLQGVGLTRIAEGCGFSSTSGCADQGALALLATGAAVFGATEPEVSHTRQLGGGGELGRSQLSRLSLKAIHLGFQHGEFLLELLHQALDLGSHLSDAIETSVQQGSRFVAGHRDVALEGAIGIAGDAAVLLDQVGKRLVSPIGGLNVRELADAGHLTHLSLQGPHAVDVLLLGVAVDCAHIEALGLDRHGRCQTEKRRGKQQLAECVHGSHTQKKGATRRPDNSSLTKQMSLRVIHNRCKPAAPRRSVN